MPVNERSYENDVDLGAYRAEVDRLHAEVERLREAMTSAARHIERAPSSRQCAAAMRVLEAALNAS